MTVELHGNILKARLSERIYTEKNLPNGFIGLFHQETWNKGGEYELSKYKEDKNKSWQNIETHKKNPDNVDRPCDTVRCKLQIYYNQMRITNYVWSISNIKGVFFRWG